MASREDILEATIDVFNEKGIKFTMDELAKKLSISKKTIYTFFPDKKTLFLTMTDYLFDEIKASERAVYEDPNLTDLEKFKKILFVLPDRFMDIDFSKMKALREDYPEIYDHIAERLDSGWELTTDLYLSAVKNGKVREVDIRILKSVLEGSINQLLLWDDLTGESYRKSLNEVLDVILVGVLCGD